MWYTKRQKDKFPRKGGLCSEIRIYDEEDGYPEGGIEPGTKWDDLPDDFVCPLCGVGKDSFSAE